MIFSTSASVTYLMPVAGTYSFSASTSSFSSALQGFINVQEHHHPCIPCLSYNLTLLLLCFFLLPQSPPATTRPLMPHSSSSSNMLTCAVRGGMGPNSLVTVRCLPVGDDDGLLQLSGTNPGDAIMGDVDTEPRPGMGQEQRREGRSQAAGACVAVQPSLDGFQPKVPACSACCILCACRGCKCMLS